MYLTELEEKQVKVLDKITKHHNQVKRLFDKKSKYREFQVGDLVLLFVKRREPK
ncbi:hypothetical protein KI387_026386, partial [Taxus chinensis]